MISPGSRLGVDMVEGRDSLRALELLCVWSPDFAPSWSLLGKSAEEQGAPNCHPFWNTVIQTADPQGMTCLYEKGRILEVGGRSGKFVNVTFVLSPPPFSIL